MTTGQLFAFALRQHQAGQLADAEKIYRDILAIDPNHVDSLHLLGVVAQQRGRPEVAIELIGKAIALNDRVSTFHNNIGEALRAVGRLDDALSHIRRAIELEPTFAEAHLNFGNALKQQGRNEEAAAQYQRALGLNANYAEAHANLGIVHMDQGRLTEAIACYRRALAIRPNFAAAEMNLGIALQHKGESDEAIAHHRRALALQPDYVLALMNLGDALFDRGDVGEAIARYEDALRITTGGSGPDSRSVWPAESLAAMSTGGRPLYPVEDKCVMGLVRAHCWQNPVRQWDRLCAAALTHPGLCSGLAASLEAAHAAFALVEKPNSNVRNSHAYAGYLQALLSYVGENPDIRSDASQCLPLPIIGDSHGLGYDGTAIGLDGVAYTGQARLIMGFKAWHLGNDKPNRYKRLLDAIIDDLPANSTAICSFGEIDCRIDEGILPHYRKAGGELETLIADQVDRFVGHVARSAERRSLKLMFLAVPAPFFKALAPRYPDLTRETQDLLVRIIQAFNRSLERAAVATGHRVIDVHRISAGPDGAASGRHHLDDIHLKPNALSLALSGDRTSGDG